MDNKQKHIDLINRRLSYLQTEVKNANSLNLTDINIIAENFYKEFLNLLGYNFSNTNFDQQNTAYIDLIDHNKKIAIQITSQNDNKKIKESIIGFYKKPKYSGYKLKLLLISKDAKDYKTPFGENFNHKEDVLDVKRLLKQIEDKETETLERIANFLNKEILTERIQTESNEVETIMVLIDFLSKDENRQLTEIEGEVDPKRKIQIRFKDHADYITNKYLELYVFYNIALEEAKKKIDSVKSRLISSYLQDESDIFLIKENNDPRLALAKLVDNLNDKLSVNGFKYDKQAIRYYLLDELINCNVFPNK